ncbi:MAG: UDP-N-acetylmuramoyl-tripeptide--D-alanyl-D-alanine ligase [Bdellovibrionales bacterium]|nr:UDP-N-acetylmuramoyl-tripeptide--D-alanyl-D-alanine ligase [Bdellovibrionales bacterium]
MSGDKVWTCDIADLAKATSGQVLSETHKSFSRVGTDSRASLAGKLFIPLKGENFDAHNFVAQAVENQAAVVMVSQWREEWKPLLAKASFVQVGDTLQALQALARFWRRKMGFKVLAITGSNGKTSTKEFAYTILKDHLSVYASKGSFNNHWGVPLSLLDAGPEHTHVIQEMGMNHSGEIWRLCQIAEPDVVVVTSVGRAHIGELGSQEAVAQAKEEIYSGAPHAVHIFNGDNEWTMRMQSRSQAKQLMFSAFKPAADVHFRAQRLTWEGLDIVGHIQGVKGHTWVHVLGRQNTINLMAASALAVAAGLTPEQIWKSLGTIHDSAWGRNQFLPLTNGAHVLFDAYNANPDSMTALLKNLYEMDATGRKFLIAGDMLELGSFGDKAHEEVGERAGAVGFEAVWYVGKNQEAFARGLRRSGSVPQYFHSLEPDPKISQQLLGLLRKDDVVAVKASRGVGLERAFENWPLKTPLGKKP